MSDNKDSFLDILDELDSLEIQNEEVKHENLNNKRIVSREEKYYNEALEKMNSKDFDEAKRLFYLALDFKDSREKIEECKNAILQSKYDVALTLINEKKYSEAIKSFSEIIDFKDSKEKIEECKNAILQSKYDVALTLINGKKYSEAIKSFSEIIDFKDSREKIEEYKKLKEEYDKEVIYKSCLIGDKKLAVTAASIKTLNDYIVKLTKIKGYKDSESLITKYKNLIVDFENQIKKANEALKRKMAKQKKRRKRIAILISAFSSIAIAVVLLTIFLFIPLSRESKIKDLINQKNYDEAYQLIEKNSNFRDTSKLENMCNAGKAFDSLNYEKGIDYIHKLGGEVDVLYDTNGGYTSTTGEKINSSKYITNTSSKDGYYFKGWILEEYSMHAFSLSASITLKAQYNTTGYTITYNLDGGFDNYKNPWTYTIETNTITLEDPTKEGYTFLGWTCDGVSEPTKNLTIEKGSIGNKIFYANWQINQYTITFKNEDGTILSSEELDYGSTPVYSQATPLKDSDETYTYSFRGWDKEITMVTENTTYTATYTSTYIDYTITFDKSNGEGGSDSVVANYGLSMPSAIAPTREGYTFEGYYDSNNVKYYDLNMTSVKTWDKTEDTTLIASWTANSYTVTLDQTYTVSFDLNGAEGSVESQTITSTTGLTYPSIPTRSGYVFAGWYTTNSCTTLFDFTSTITQDTTLYAKWISYSGYGVLYVGSNSGSITFPARTSSSYRYYAFVPLVSESITIYSSGSKDTYGYLFNSSKSQLSSNDDGGTNQNFSITYSVTAGTLYYIVPCAYSFSSSVTSTVYINGTSKPTAGGKASGNQSVNITYDSAFALPTVSKEGYTFEGWYSGTNGSGIQYTDSLGNCVKAWDIASDTKLYPKWEINQ